MLTLGEFLKELRDSKELTLKEVYDKTGITDSKLSRIENDETREPSPFALKKLAEFYDSDIISMFILAGYLDEKSVAGFSKVFHGVDLLFEEEKEHIQQQIDLFTKRRT